MEAYKVFTLPSLPRGDSKHSYMVFDNNKLMLKDIDGNVIQEKVLDNRI